MIIDFHTHAFPDSMAEKAVGKLAKTANLTPVGDGTVSDLLEYKKKYDVDTCVLLHIAVKPSSVRDVNDFADATNQLDGVAAFGSVHPMGDDVTGQVEDVKARGLYGIKLHPAYQRFELFDDRADEMFGAIEKSGLPVLIHAGWDPYDGEHTWAFPKDEADVLARHPNLKMILAHMGGMMCWDDVDRYLVGKNVYFDLANCAQYMPFDQYIRLAKKHGADRLLLGSDYPWETVEDEMDALARMGLSSGEMEKILYQNARELLSSER